MYSLIAFAVIAVSVGIVKTVKASPIYFPPTTQTALATTSPAFIGNGTGTSTLTFNAYFSGSPTAARNAVLLTQFAASSTSAILTMSIQYSQNGIDWYDNDLGSGNGTSTVTDVSSAQTYKWTPVGTATSSKAIYIITPTQYVRVVYSLLGAAGAVWGQFVPEKEYPDNN